MIIHSPLVGPSTVAPLAATMDARGWVTMVPDLRTSIDSPARFREHASCAADAADVVIGHSGAGVFLPAVADAMNAAAVFVDAVVPPPQPAFTPSAQLVDLLDRLPVVDGFLPPWGEWWPVAVTVELVPDEALRERITAEMPRVPRSFFDEAVPLPAQWWRRPAVYLQLSPAYDDDRARADSWSWPTSQVAGRHLDLSVRPELVADHITDLVRRLDDGAR